VRARINEALRELAGLNPAQRGRCLAAIRGGDIRALAWAWDSHALDEQLEPEGA
jgi:hypothetical protein